MDEQQEVFAPWPLLVVDLVARWWSLSYVLTFGAVANASMKTARSDASTTADAFEVGRDE
jgi:hypothetical protein